MGITEGGAAGSVCVVLTGTTGSPTELVNPLAVSVGSVLNADAGRLLIISFTWDRPILHRLFPPDIPYMYVPYSVLFINLSFSWRG